MIIFVQNAVGITDDQDPDGNINRWKKECHWNNSKILYCSVVGCFEKVKLVGAHVEIVDDPSEKQFIVPMCREHNGQHGKELHINDVYLMPAEKLN
jgi:hypothetical protein